MTEEQTIELKVRFESYKILNFIFREPIDIKSDFKRNDFKLDFKADFKADLKNNTIGIKLGVNIQLKSKPPVPIAFIEVEYIYKISGLNKIQEDESERGMAIPSEFLATLISLSYSTTRGVLLAKGMGTIIEKVILPIIDPHKLLPKQMLKKVSEEV